MKSLKTIIAEEILKEKENWADDWNAWKAGFNKEWKDLSKNSKIWNSKFKTQVRKSVAQQSDSLTNLTFKTREGTEWSIGFLDGYVNEKPAVTVQISSKAKPGVIEKKFSGKNSAPDKLLPALNKFFNTGKWK